MNPLTEHQIRTSFVNASKGVAQRAALPDLAEAAWEDLDYLGWQDAKKPQQHYVVLEVDGEIVGLLLRGTGRPPGKKMLCAWCEDVIDGVAAASFVAPLAGASGRRGNTKGTAVCADFRCSRNVRRAPAAYELRSEDPALLAYHREQRIAGLRERSTGFARAIMGG
ncbi:FBP domain-containing protein [Brachybacterium sp. YJGR34]|uniref:FBP domain-containing protein n=1 Tax=Brachybacterium sp. YJGR34 TaxID=2059911 RepID=UPI000E0A767D|nr:FBP domain-containing protein [Brachybacterium sp. YJGR34]